jgi:L-asparaginase / beta-aspartyl-peptidase
MIPTTPVILVHGGAGRIAAENLDAARAGVERAVAAGRRYLQAGDVVEAVVAAVRAMEDDPVFNAGRGACMNADGQVEVDAGLMRGRDLAIGAIAAVPELGDAITVARAVLDHSPHSLLAGQGAVRFARHRGVGNFGRDAVWTAKAQARWEAAVRGEDDASGQADTVGAIAIDASGHLAAACSTGGVLLKTPGRVGDSPIPGAGFYAADGLGASCATGVGEAILRRVACYDVLLRTRAGLPAMAAAQAVCDAVVDGDASVTCGLIVLDAQGRVGVAHRSAHMSHAWAIGDGATHVAVVAGR